jgi:hypothetical protein
VPHRATAARHRIARRDRAARPFAGLPLTLANNVLASMNNVFARANPLFASANTLFTSATQLTAIQLGKPFTRVNKLIAHANNVKALGSQLPCLQLSACCQDIHHPLNRRKQVTAQKKSRKKSRRAESRTRLYPDRWHEMVIAHT